MNSCALQQRRPIILWVLFSASCVAGGWTLSVLHQLNAAGYMGWFILNAVAVMWWWRQARHSGLCGPSSWWSRACHRYRRPLPAIFLVLAVLVAVGGALYYPSNTDAMAYRLPRVLHWLNAGRWHWIQEASGSLNTRPTGFEWLMAPLLAGFRSDRPIFLINYVSFLLLPGLFFSVFTRLGVRRQVAWQWMWILPSGYVFLLQAGGSSNDAFAAVYALAMVDFALRARESRRVSNVWLSLLSAALLSGAKLSNLPLLLVGLVAVAPSLRLLLGRPLWSAVFLIWIAAVSFLPVALLNHHYCGDWSGAKVVYSKMAHVDPVAAIIGNTLYTLVQNLTPPVFPFTAGCRQASERLVPTWLKGKINNTFDSSLNLAPPELPQEEQTGLGLGVCLLVLLSCVWSACFWVKSRGSRPTLATARSGDRFIRVVRWSAYLALLGYMARMALSVGPGRYLAPYYALLLPALLATDWHTVLVRQRWWRWTGSGVMAAAIVAVILTPSRPLWPARTITNWLARRYPGTGLVHRAQTVYNVYGDRWDALAPVRVFLPVDATKIGLVTFTSTPMETSLWRPFGTRSIVSLAIEADPAVVRQQGIRHVVCGVDMHALPVSRLFPAWRSRWLERSDVQIVGQTNLLLLASGQPSTWYVLFLPSREDSNRSQICETNSISLHPIVRSSNE